MIVPVYDATHDNIGHLPPGRAAGYTTGSGGVAWIEPDWDAHPGAVRICQDPGATDTTADVLDVESGAATYGDCPVWAKAAIGHFAAGTRLGQRKPAIYASASAITPVVNALNAGGVHSGVGLWVADWSLTDAQARADILAAAGPFPIVGMQDRSFQFYDSSVFALAWLDAVSGAAPVPVPDDVDVHLPAGEWTRLPHSVVEVRPQVRDVVVDVRHLP